MVRTKVFVGNLAFSTKEPELAAAFGTAGKVIGANIITRGPRSLGYGFVEMDSEEDAKKAVELMNKKELNGRQINVEVAKPQEEVKEREPRPQSDGAARGARGGRGRGGSRRTTGYRRRRSPGKEGEDEGEDNKAEEGQEGNDDEPRRRPRRRNRKPGQRKNSDAEPQSEREESKTTLFVANLPFGLDDEGFAKVVQELGIKPKTAHVVKKRNGRSKGYGFIEFENEADQKKALDGLNKKIVEERELSVKVALTEQARDDAEPQDKSAAPAEKKPAAPAEKKTAPAEKKTTPTEKKPAEQKDKAPAAKPVFAEKKTDKPADKPAEKKADKPAEKPAEKKAEKPAEKKTTPVVEKKTEKPAEKKSAPPAEKKSTPPTEKKAESSPAKEKK